MTLLEQQLYEALKRILDGLEQQAIVSGRHPQLSVYVRAQIRNADNLIKEYERQAALEQPKAHY